MIRYSIYIAGVQGNRKPSPIHTPLITSANLTKHVSPLDLFTHPPRVFEGAGILNSTSFSPSRSTLITTSQTAESLPSSIYLETEQRLLTVQRYFSLMAVAHSSTKRGLVLWLSSPRWAVFAAASPRELPAPAACRSCSLRSGRGWSPLLLSHHLPSGAHRASRQSGPEGRDGSSLSLSPRPRGHPSRLHKSRPETAAGPSTDTQAPRSPSLASHLSRRRGKGGQVLRGAARRAPRSPADARAGRQLSPSASGASSSAPPPRRHRAGPGRAASSP